MDDKDATERLYADLAGISRAASILRAGGIVAVPTETVYGLAARADNADAVAKIYAAKGRPGFNPLIVHVASIEHARTLAHFSAMAEAVAALAWPGALTLVLPRRGDAQLAPAVSAGLDTVAQSQERRPERLDSGCHICAHLQHMCRPHQRPQRCISSLYDVGGGEKSAAGRLGARVPGAAHVAIWGALYCPRGCFRPIRAVL